jgi:phosphatidylserine/phosphatidylglycerophosphate/cardiolipin synthase-like enzyme
MKATDRALLVLDEDYLPVLMKLLEQAKSSIDIIAFSFAIGSASGKINKTSAPFQIAEKLIEIKRKFKSKIQIRLYIEGERETSDRNSITAEYLADHGIDVRYGTSHAKGFCIDKKYVLFGSTNLTHQSIIKNSEANLLLTDKDCVRGFELYFEHLWAGGRHGGITLPPPMIADGGFKKVLLEMIDTAKSSLEFSIFYFHVSEIEKAFIEAADRGVKVIGYIHDHAAFALSYVRRTHGTAERLRAGGINEIHYAPKNLFTHSKYLIKDRKELLLGTGNWLHEDIKVHPQLYVHLYNPELCKELARHLSGLVKASKKGETLTERNLSF